MGLIKWVRAQFDAPAEVQFSAEYKPLNTLIEGLFRGGGSIGRDEALSVPAVRKGRNMICSISTLPLEAVSADNVVQDHPLLRQIDANVPNVVTMAQTLEDLLFEGASWWRITGFGWDGYPVSAVRYDPNTVSQSPPAGYTGALLPSGLPTEGVVWMNGEKVPHAKVIKFESPNGPLLREGQRAIRRAIALDLAAEMYAEDPRPMDYFTPADATADPVDDVTVVSILNDWRAARRKRSTGYVPAALTYHEVQQPTPADLQLVSLQDKATKDIAILIGVDPEELGVSTTSRTYQNGVDRRKDKINDLLSSYMRAITDRLSMPDVTKRGVTVRFNLDDYLKADPKTRAEVQQIYQAMGVTDAAEIREAEGLPPRRIQAPTPPAPVQQPRRVTSTTGDPMPQLQAGQSAEHTFDRKTGFTFDGDLAEFAVDAEARTITGLAVPYNQAARSQGRRWRFAKGSIKYSAVNRVKLLRDHDNSQAIGKATRLEDTDAGLVATFKVSPGRAGDEALALALDGVLDGLSIGVDFHPDHFSPDPREAGVNLVSQAALREVSLTAVPSFDDSRLTSVTASDTREESGMPEETTETRPANEPVHFSAEMAAQFAAFLEQNKPEPRPVVNPTGVAAQVNEPTPYKFDRAGNFASGDYDFSADLLTMSRSNDNGDNGGEGPRSAAGKRVMGLIQAEFTNTTTSTTATVNPSIQRPDMYVDQRDYKYPLWSAVNKGAPPNGVTPFIFPKFSSAGTLVAAHTEGTEPAAGAFTTTNQTVTPTALSGKASITREVWDQGGNPAVSGLIWNQMKKAWFEGLETATGTFLNTLTAATDINLNTGATASAAPTSVQLQGNWEAALAGLQYARGYDWEVFALEPFLYAAFVAAADSTGRKLYPILSPMNANGTAAERFRQLNLAGVVGIPAWGLGAGTGGSVNNSWLFDPSVVHGWATAPQRLEFPGTASDGTYAPVAMVDLGIWGYKAFANSDIGGVRQVTYDTTT